MEGKPGTLEFCEFAAHTDTGTRQPPCGPWAPPGGVGFEFSEQGKGSVCWLMSLPWLSALSWAWLLGGNLPLSVVAAQLVILTFRKCNNVLLSFACPVE